ncbi:MAG: hypothetical protein QXX20_06380 [Candidatus Thermoplasmatota archaeon]
MDEGFILSNKHRRAIFYEIASGEKNINRIIKKQHIIRSVAEKIISDFISEGILEQQGDTIWFTTEGKKLAEKMGK